MARSMLPCALLAAVVFFARPLAPQTLVGVVPGDTVRVIASGAEPRVRGVFVAIRDDSVFVRNYSHTVGVPVSRIERIDVRRKRSILEGIGRGVAIGAPLGLVTGYAFGRAAEGGPHGCGDDCGLVSTIMAATGLAAGTGLGFIFGAAMPGKRWEQVSARPAVAAGLARGAGLALSLSLPVR